MKIIRVLFTIILALLLFPTIWLSLQSTTIYLTLYDVAFIQEIGRESDLSEQIIDSTIDYTVDIIENSDFELPVSLDKTALLNTLLEHIDRVSLKNMVDDFSIGSYEFLFGTKETLPIIDTSYLQDLSDLGLSLASEQLLDTLASSSNELDTELIDQKALEDMVNNQLPTIVIPKTVDVNQLATTLYNNEINPISSARMITYDLPQYFLWILGILLVGIPLLYLIINRFRFIATLQFFALTGLIATLFNLIGTVLLYWFLPNASQQLTSTLTSDVPMIASSVDFLQLLSSHILSKAITINLFALIAFLVILLLTELKKKLYPTESTTDTSTQALLQVVGALVIAAMIGFFVNYQWNNATETIANYQSILTEFENHTIDVNPDTLLETLAN